MPVTPLSPPAASQDQAAGLAAAWLRAHCPCDRCQDPGSGQRLARPAGLPAEVRVTAVPGPDGDLRATFWPDGHQAAFRRSWLAAQAAPAVDERTGDAKRLWAAADFPAGPPAWPWPDYQARGAARAEGLAALLDDGMLLLRGVPAEPGAVLTVAQSLGTCGRPTTGGCSTCGSPRRRPAWRSPGCPSPRTLARPRPTPPSGRSRIAARPALMLRFRLERGDCVPFDNTRVLHARTGFAAAGTRHLRGCYADLDGVSSSLAVLRRRTAP